VEAISSGENVERQHSLVEDASEEISALN